MFSDPVQRILTSNTSVTEKVRRSFPPSAFRSIYHIGVCAAKIGIFILININGSKCVYFDEKNASVRSSEF